MLRKFLIILTSISRFFLFFEKTLSDKDSHEVLIKELKETKNSCTNLKNELKKRSEK